VKLVINMNGTEMHGQQSMDFLIKSLYNSNSFTQ